MSFSILGGIGLVAVIATLSIALTTSAYVYHRGSSISVTQIINQHNMVKNGGTGTNSITINGHSTTQTRTHTQTSSQVGGTQGVVRIPSQIPINSCGNIVNFIGTLNPSFGNTCKKFGG